MAGRGRYTIATAYTALLRCWGPQHWWPGDTPFEIMVGAVLTQNTAWTNVERAIANLKRHRALSARAILAVPADTLAEWLRPSGYFNVKAKRLKALCAWYRDNARRIRYMDTVELRHALLAVHGIGPETADDILLYAWERPVFVIDAYTRRLFSRLGIIDGDESYETLRGLFENRLRRRRDRVAVFNEYHALIVRHAKDVCRPRPRCEQCCLRRGCPSRVASSE
ncbi:MAG TPA: endonuclease [Gammaproteobacteria bacterium]|nr:endonuclease [Gammaproteobacteria bacterium]